MKKTMGLLLAALLVLSAMTGFSALAEDAYTIGCISKMQSTAFHKAMALQFEASCEEYGWKGVQLDSNDELEKEQVNMESLISMGVDLIIINAEDPDVSVVGINAAVNAGIPVIAVDTSTSAEGKQITTVLCDSVSNGIEIGKYLVTEYGADELISSICVSGNKGNPTGYARRVGVIAGVYMGRGGLDRDAAWAKAVALEQGLTDNGSCKDDEINFEIVGQAWGAWETSAGLSAVEDQLVAHPDINCMFGENDSMLLGGLQALQNRGMTETVKIFAACDGQKEAYEAIMAGGAYLATGRNDPAQCMKDAFVIAKAVLTEGKTADDYAVETYMAPLAVTRANVEEVYDANASF